MGNRLVRPVHSARALLSLYSLFSVASSLGLGGLLVKRTSMHALIDETATTESVPPPSQLTHATTSTTVRRRHYFGGGSVDLVLPAQDIVVTRRNQLPHHGTIHYRGIVALEHGFLELDRVGGMAAIQQHTQCLGQEFIRRLRVLQHANGRAAMELYIDAKEHPQQPRSTVAFNVRRADGTYVGYNEIAKLAALNVPPIQLRTGCMCNPGACQRVLQLSDDDVLRNYHETGHVCGDHVDIIRGKPTGVVRVSFGKDSIWEDMDACAMFLENMFVSRYIGKELGGNARSVDAWQPVVEPTIIANVTELYIYPIKSCGAQRVRSWEIDVTSGRLSYDREFALVDSSGHALRLQSYPKMSLLKPEVMTDKRVMKVSALGHASLFIQLEDSVVTSPESIQICGDSCGGTIVADCRTSDWFSTVLGIKCWLARHMEEKPLSNSMSSPRSRNVAFANERPLLLISTHAVDLLNTVLKDGGQSPVQSLHFRPNIVIRVLTEPETNNHIEDNWKALKSNSGHLELNVVGPCARCSMVDFHPDNGKRGKTLRALSEYRRANGQINFGIFLQLAQTNEIHASSLLGEGDTFLCSR